MLELWFDFSCPYAYLASRKAAALARAAGVTLDWRPMLLGGVFRGIGGGDGPMKTLGPAKAAHNYQDMHRWAEIFGAPFQIPAAHPMRTVRALRVLCALPRSRWPAAIEAIYAAYWQRAQDITRDDVIAQALDGAGFADADIATALRRADDPDIKDELRARTDEAIELGIFGAPAWVVRRRGKPPVMLWGQDRMAWVEAVLAGWELDGTTLPFGSAAGQAAVDASEPPGGPRPFGANVQAVASPRTLDIYFDVASPFAYLGLTQATALAAWCTPRLHPILLGALFRDIGQPDVPLFSMPPAKRAYTMLEMPRWARWWGVPFTMPHKFPQRTIAAQRLCILAAQRGFEDGVRIGVALGRAMWAEQRDLEDDATLRDVLAEVGMPAEWLERTRDPAVKALLVDETAKARAAGVFGVPTWVIDQTALPFGSAAGRGEAPTVDQTALPFGSAAGRGEAPTVDGTHVVWGQDRLEVVMRMLGGWRPERG